jgi:hypothetical protein
MVAPIALRRVALIGRRSGAELAEPLSRLAAFLAASGHEVVIEEETARATRFPPIVPRRPKRSARTPMSRSSSVATARCSVSRGASLRSTCRSSASTRDDSVS